MFRRREKRSLVTRARALLWPEAGWSRAGRYIFHRTARLPGTPYSLAAGFACGAAISFTPLVGFHIILGGLWAWLVRGNLIASTIGTAVGNPWSFPFIWLWIYQFGHWLGIGPDLEGGIAGLDFAAFFGDIMKATLSLDLDFLVATAGPVWWPMMVGSLPTAAAVWAGFYFGLRPVIAGYQKRRVERRLERLAQLDLGRRLGPSERRHTEEPPPDDTGDRRRSAGDRRHTIENKSETAEE